MGERADKLARLYEEHGPAVWNYAARHVDRRQDADDVLQEVFLVAARDFDDLDGARSIRAWLVAVARNVIRHRRRRGAWMRTTAMEDASLAARQLDVDPRIPAMRDAIGRLPEIYREVLELRIAQDLSYEEIAHVLGIPIGTVRSRLHNAVATLRDWAERFDRDLLAIRS